MFHFLFPSSSPSSYMFRYLGLPSDVQQMMFTHIHACAHTHTDSHQCTADANVSSVWRWGHWEQCLMIAWGQLLTLRLASLLKMRDRSSIPLYSMRMFFKNAIYKLGPGPNHTQDPLAPWPWTSWLSKLWEINYCLSFPVYKICKIIPSWLRLFPSLKTSTARRRLNTSLEGGQ